MIEEFNTVEPELLLTKAGMESVPDAASPIPGLLLVQLKLAPGGLLVKVLVETGVPAHST